MKVATRLDVVHTLENAAGQLEAMARTVEIDTMSVSKAFQGLAGHSDTILNLAGAIVGCVENQSVTSVLPTVQALGVEANHFIAARLRATTGILATVDTEVGLLRQLSDVAASEEAIALEIKVLSVLTNIEVAHLGTVGTGFQYLARELAEFSKSVIADTHELASHTSIRRVAIEDTRRSLSAELPRLRQELTRIEADLGNALVTVEASLTELSRTPLQFRGGVEEIARQIAGVVAALQSQDITRQMNEHVQEAFALIAARTQAAANLDPAAGGQELPLLYAGVTIQIYQLRSIKQTVGHWIAQIRSCMAAILRISASEVLAIAPTVLDQERKVAHQLARIELLEAEGQDYSQRIQHTLAGLANLMQLVSEHVLRSKSIRDRLRLLAFNSIIEASHLGTRADVILAISKSIKEVSTAWGEITDQSGQAMEQILKLVEQSNELTKVFSEAGSQGLRDAQVQTRGGLEHLRGAAGYAASQAEKMKTATDQMQASIAEIEGSGHRLDAGFGACDKVLSTVENLQHQLESDEPDGNRSYDLAEVEQLFAASYTTEREREVLRAALRGAALPVAEPGLAGNSIELF